MVEDAILKAWFCDEILPLERALTHFIRRNWRTTSEVTDLRQDIYERILIGARSGVPLNARHYLFTVARNHLINCAKRAQVVSFELVADMAVVEHRFEMRSTETQLSARDELRRAEAGFGKLPPRCRQVVMLRKLEGLSTRETAERLGISVHTVEKQLTQGMRALTDHMLGGSGKVARRALFGVRKAKSQ
ncbi:RNA polymerase sigma factor [Sphingomonas sp. URHD0057]|uniref:RNA polymerase sigma factor n=1 Tax=Sphingomonas sp. URHD0057 TaxID=1380389 RepID=UPI00048FBE4D|nr:RNA polymerase sigma factor [Sphingomonas sp. URHD0057]